MRWTRWLAWSLIALGAVLILVWLGRVVIVAQSLRTHLAQFESLATSAGASDPAYVCNLVWDTRDDVTSVRRDLGGIVGVAPILGWLPGVGGDLRAAPSLLVAGGESLNAGSLICEAMAYSGANSFSLEEVARAFAENPARIRDAISAFTRAEQAMMNVDATNVSSRVAAIKRALSLVRAGLELASHMQRLGGFDQPRTYLLLALNEDELRPGGGFITGVGQVRVERGRIAAISFRDSYAVDDFSKPYPEPPEPLKRYMGIDQWVFRDSNWSPDFPTSAQQAIELYRVSDATMIEGVIAVDQRAVQALIAAIGPLTIPDSREPITGANLIAYIHRAWAPSDGSFAGNWWARRKSFMGPLADAMRAKIEAGDFNKVALAETLLRLIETKHLQIYFGAPEAQTILREQSWDSALRASGDDYLMVVDANLGYNKVSARVQSSVAYQMDLSASPPKAELDLVYTHTVAANYPCRPEARYDAVYTQMMERCYWNYLRVLVPANSQLDQATQVPLAASAVWSRESEAGAVVARVERDVNVRSLAAMMILPTGATQARKFALTASPDVLKWQGAEGRYALRFQKQAGTPDYPLQIQVRLPNATTLLEAMPAPVSVNRDVVVWRMRVERDQDFRLRFKRQ